MDYLRLKSGTDVRGVASEGVEGQHIDLTDEVVERIAYGYLLWCEENTGKKVSDLEIAVGHDSRISADRIKTAMINAMVKKGAKVYDLGLSSTPSLFMATLHIPCDASVQITASHHPFNRNGLKFFTKNGGLDSPDISFILKNAQEAKQPEDLVGGKSEKLDFMKTYSGILREMIKKGVNSDEYDLPLKGFKIVVDAGNGAGGFYAKDVLEVLGADVSASQFLEPDGMFPNHAPNPEDKKAMKSISEATVKANADLGVIFDTDVDRGGAVFKNGEEINRNSLIAIMSAIAISENEGATIVTDSVTSQGLKTYIEEDLKGVHHRFKRGYKNIINEAIRLTNEGINCPLAIETSGHAAMKENYFLDDGAYLITKLIIKMANLKKEGKYLDSLIASLKHPVEEDEIRFPITAYDFKTVGQDALDKLENYCKEKGYSIADDNREGIRVSFNESGIDGWFLLRMSVHDPIMALNIESGAEGGNQKIAKKLKVFFDSFDFSEINTSTLDDFLI